MFCGNLFEDVNELANETLTITTIGEMVEVILNELCRTAGVAPEQHWWNVIHSFFAHTILDYQDIF
jgi:hypothetical protein